MRSLLRAMLAGALLTACAEGPFAPGRERGWMEARVQGSVVSNYEGSATFHIEYVDGYQDDALFELRSEDELRGGAERIVIQRFGDHVPGAGAYWIGDGAEFFARYERYRNGHWEWYTADFGVLDLWSSASHRMEGQFRFSAALTCVGDGYTMHCDSPASPGAPRILVEGTFTGVRGSGYQWQ